MKTNFQVSRNTTSVGRISIRDLIDSDGMDDALSFSMQYPITWVDPDA